MIKRFVKRDEGFVCQNCGHLVPQLLSSSRDHCTHCLCSKHVDICPGDRANPCGGMLRPVGVEVSGKKGYIIKYHCDTCGLYHNCKCAPDDDLDEIINVCRQIL